MHELPRHMSENNVRDPTSLLAMSTFPVHSEAEQNQHNRHKYCMYSRRRHYLQGSSHTPKMRCTAHFFFSLLSAPRLSNISSLDKAFIKDNQMPKAKSEQIVQVIVILQQPMGEQKIAEHAAGNIREIFCGIQVVVINHNSKSLIMLVRSPPILLQMSLLQSGETGPFMGL